MDAGARDATRVGSMCSRTDYSCSLSNETLQIAKDELNENPDTRHLELQTLRERLLRYPGLRPRTDPVFLLSFLRVRKFDQERAFEMIIKYYKVRKEYPAIFNGLKPSSLREVMLESSFLVRLPHRDRLGRVVAVVTPANVDFSRFEPDDIVKHNFIANFKTMMEEETQVRGLMTILDMKDYTVSHFLSAHSITFRYKLTRVIQDCMPNRTKAMLIVNESGVFDVFMEFLNHVLQAKLVRRIHRIGTDWKRLHEFIDPTCLPQQYGGTLPVTMETIKQQHVGQLLELDRAVEEDGKYGFVDFTLTKPSSSSSSLSSSSSSADHVDAFDRLPGTFRKLDN